MLKRTVYLDNESNDPNNITEQNMTHMVRKIVSLVEERLAKGVGSPSRGINNEVVEEAGFAYNTPSAKSGQIVGGK